ncbi:MAG: kynureninase [Flavobacteriaceae bacterium]
MYKNELSFALDLDRKDPLSKYRSEFNFPYPEQKGLYFCGNSLGLQSKRVEKSVQDLMNDWKNLAVDGHFYGDNPWMYYHDEISEKMAKVVGAKPIEVSVMNTLTANLHFLMVSFYKPSIERYKIIVEEDAFPSDNYVVESQVKHHGFSREESIVYWKKNKSSGLLELSDLEVLVQDNKESLALIMVGGVNYYTGQRLELDEIARIGHEAGAKVGIDLAHAAGNVPLNLHDSNIDFAAWCTYKYMNSGPGAIGGMFVHERYAYDKDLNRFAGWWGHNKETRFKMRLDFDPIPGAEGWMQSNQPMLSLAPIKASMDLFDEIGMDELRKKSIALTGYLEFLLTEIKTDRIRIITPVDKDRRGCQLSIQIKGADKSLFQQLLDQHIIGDWREPDVIRISPTPMYNSFEDVYVFVQALKDLV